MSQRDVNYVLGLDLATKTGWCIWDKGNNKDTSGVWDFSLKKDESDSMRPIKFRANLNTLIEAYPEFKDQGLVTWEQVNFVKHRYAYKVHVELVTTVKIWCADHNIPCTTSDVTSIKRFATGKGNAGKDLMAKAFKDKWPLRTFVDDNEIDAVWLTYQKIEELGLR